jgi:hypothetical protein
MENTTNIFLLHYIEETMNPFGRNNDARVTKLNNELVSLLQYNQQNEMFCV